MLPFTIRIDELTKIKLFKLAKKLDMTPTDMIRVMIDKALNEPPGKLKNAVSLYKRIDSYMKYYEKSALTLGRWISAAVTRDSELMPDIIEYVAGKEEGDKALRDFERLSKKKPSF